MVTTYPATAPLTLPLPFLDLSQNLGPAMARYGTLDTCLATALLTCHCPSLTYHCLSLAFHHSTLPLPFLDLATAFP